MEKYTITISDSNFESEVLKSTKPVLIDFWAEWCGPCRMVGPIVDQLAEEYDGKVVVGKVNVDENPSIASQYGIRSIPSLLVFSNGKVEEQIVGAVPKARLQDSLNKYIS
ncbi:MAG: thioredoxin [Candidatus Marinimicrobia bacterium]|nr:thioredoxin [Candidatus Neomarinimicrobiota bacterium]